MERWRRIDAAPEHEARDLLRTCCGATRWIERMLARRPFGSRDVALRVARDEWFALSPEDWIEAFSHHPRIGDVDSLRRKFAATRALSEREQSGVSGASEAVLGALLDGNREYEARFGYIFIVCATGRTAEEMLTLLRARLGNDPEAEIRIAAEEHAKICELRLSSPALPPSREALRRTRRSLGGGG
jgi:2-oxo-4-hydroxy-4-carboxy-5-ureidoimidazoline decarboxylase